LIKDLAQTIARSVENPRATVSADSRQERLALCLACPKILPPPAPWVNLHRCSVCNCLMEAKTWLSGARCPLPEPVWDVAPASAPVAP